MTGIDTNILVRYFADDDAAQTEVARRFLESLTPENPGYVSTVALLELWWVLGGRYDMEKIGLVRTVRRLLASPHLRIEHEDEVAEAVARFVEGRASLQDYLVERRCFGAGCARTMTFDRAAARSAGMTLVDQIPIASPAPSSVSTPSTAKMAAAIP
ncbi:PIN domain-containing protein [Roseateles chitosanitabidus]|jgi:predicted nucleic-acid-binding protein|uniref:PIN domain-containing protein n=1 Tax=Roseateles chitosanitabidus TaxID=65048 RepID=UPI000829FCAF|nr:type II toxin-antitoxin system VapC family toxin [Roseateles chitosanitabidus]